MTRPIEPSTAPEAASAAPSHQRSLSIPFAIGGGTLAVIALGATMAIHADAKVNRVALDSSAKPVTVVEAQSSTFRGSRSYVGTVEPWVEAKIGPQMISAYVDTVLVRPSAVVKKGDVIATLDCRNANAASRSVAMQARAIAARQQAISDEATRFDGLLDGGFVSPNEVEQKAAQSSAEQAQLLAAQAQLLGTSLQVDDCVLRSPFAGEVANRTIDPGAFVRPGAAIVSVVDRSTVRIVADAPELDFPIVAQGSAVKVHLYAIDLRRSARRSAQSRKSLVARR